MAVTPGSPILQSDLAALATLANGKSELPKYNTPGNPASGNTNYAFPDWASSSRSSGANPKWLTELNRLRGNLMPVIEDKVTVIGGIYPWQQQSISGGDATANKVAGWPLSGPSINNKNLGFWYADNGSAQHVSIASSGIVQSSAKILSTATYQYLAPFESSSPTGLVSTTAQTSIEFAVIIGGAVAHTVQGDFVMRVPFAYGGTYDESLWPAPIWTSLGAGSEPAPTLDVADWITGATTSLTTAYHSDGVVDGYIYILSRVNGSVAPGRYIFRISIAVPDDTWWQDSGLFYHGFRHTRLGLAGDLYGDDFSASMFGFALNTCNIPTTSGTGDATMTGLTLGPGSAAPGIHGSQGILKIDCSSLYGTAPFGIISVVPLGGGLEHVVQQSVSITPTIAGRWTGNCAAISSVNAVATVQMPWNLVRHRTISPYYPQNPALLGNEAPTNGLSNSYDQTQPVELQAEPPGWIASRYFSVGFTIQDGNGNLEIVTVAGTSGGSAPSWPATEGNTVTDGSVIWRCRRILKSSNAWATGAKTSGYAIADANGNTQVVVTAGTSGGSAPTWSKFVGQKTTDGSVVWEMRVPINPATHRSLSVPRYPAYWANETVPALKPPTSASGLTIWGANEQWQRNSYGTGFDAGWQQDNLAAGWWIYSVSLNRMQLKPSSEVAVSIGCMRSGSFVSFGNFTTGQSVAVLWPIFTSDALVYQCAERVEIQAVAIAAAGAGASVGTVAEGYPICATFVLDVTALLALIS